MARKVVTRALGVYPHATGVAWTLVERYVEVVNGEEILKFRILAHDKFAVQNRRPEVVLTDMDRKFAVANGHKQLVLNDAENLKVGIVTQSGQILIPVALWLMKKGFSLYRLIGAITEIDDNGNSFNRQFNEDLLRSNEAFRREIFGGEHIIEPPKEFVNMMQRGVYSHGIPVISDGLRRSANAAASIIVMYENMTPPIQYKVALPGNS